MAGSARGWKGWIGSAWRKGVEGSRQDQDLRVRLVSCTTLRRSVESAAGSGQKLNASRTPEGKAWADQIRTQRAAYEALPNNKKTELEELEVFYAFAAVCRSRC